MAFQPEGFADIAANLAADKTIDSGSAECARTVAGRAYYACYLAVREAVRKQYSDPKFDVAHSDLSRALRNASDVDVRAVGVGLHNLREKRELADYNLSGILSKFDASIAVASARSIFLVLPTLIGKLPGRIPRR